MIKNFKDFLEVSSNLQESSRVEFYETYFRQLSPSNFTVSRRGDEIVIKVHTA